MGARARIAAAEANGPPAPYLTRDEVIRVLGLTEDQFHRMETLNLMPCALRRRNGNLWAWNAVKNNLLRLVPAGTIYVAGYGPYVKIGFTRGEVGYRLADLQVGCPETIELAASIPGDMSDEAALHRRFEGQRLRGEWFRREGEVDAWIDAGCPL